ncbi:MAG: ATP-binding protein [Phycisphaerae bacterium]|nr:ATP-binding protein [Phycisphaerae bacterium]
MAFNPQSLARQVVICSDLHAARDVEEEVLRVTRALGYSHECSFAIRLALEEAIVNAHKHGHRGDTTKRITISYDIDSQRAVVRVRDEGPGFDPAAVPDPTNPDRIALPCGRGIMLMRAYLDAVTFNDRGNEVQLVKENR